MLYAINPCSYMYLRVPSQLMLSGRETSSRDNEEPQLFRAVTSMTTPPGRGGPRVDSSDSSLVSRFGAVSHLECLFLRVWKRAGTARKTSITVANSCPVEQNVSYDLGQVLCEGFRYSHVSCQEKDTRYQIFLTSTTRSNRQFPRR